MSAGAVGVLALFLVGCDAKTVSQDCQPECISYEAIASSDPDGSCMTD